MRMQRSDIRIFGLVLIAFFVTLILYAGISTANAEGTILGTKILITGPIAAFISLLLVFKLIGIFNVDDEEFSISTAEPTKLKKNELVAELNKLKYRSMQLGTRREEIENMIEALDENKNYADAVSAGGMRRATRGGA